MREPLYLPFCRPTISEEAIEEVGHCIRSGGLTSGVYVARFEEMLKHYYQRWFALTVSSAAAGLQLCLEALELTPGDEVITSPMTFIATLNSIVQAQGKPVLVDIDPLTLNLDVQHIESVIGSRTRAIMPIHFAGHPAKLNEIYQLAEKYGLRVIEDCTHAIGARLNGALIGSFGDIQVMSFHPNNPITMGEGGVVLTDDREIAQRIERLRFHGMERTAFNRFGTTEPYHYDVRFPGHPFYMTDIQATLGIHQLPSLDDFIQKRSQRAERYLDALENVPGLGLPTRVPQSDLHAWHLFVVQIEQRSATMNRDRFVQQLQSRRIGTGHHYRAAHTYSWYATRYAWEPEAYPHAKLAGEQVCSLPLFPDLDIQVQDRVIQAIHHLMNSVQQLD